MFESLKENKNKIIAVVVLVAVSAAVGRFTAPSKVVEKEHVVYQDKIVEKKVYVKDKTTKKNTVTIKLTTIHPDGTKTVEVKTYDKDVIELAQNSSDAKDSSNSLDKTTEKTVEYKKTDTILSLGVKTNLTDLTSGLSYGLNVQKRMLGPIYMGGFGFTDGSAGATIGIGF